MAYKSKSGSNRDKKSKRPKKAKGPVKRKKVKLRVIYGIPWSPAWSPPGEDEAA